MACVMLAAAVWESVCVRVVSGLQTGMQVGPVMTDLKGVGTPLNVCVRAGKRKGA